MMDQSKYKKRKKNKYLFFLILIIIIFFLIYLFKISFLNTFFSSFQFFKNIETVLISKHKIIEENKSLKEKLNFYKESEDLIFFLKIENKKLKNRLNYADFLNKERLLFDVVAKDKFFYKTILVADKNKNLKKDDLIFSQYNFLIGKVISVNNEIAKVETFDSLGLTRKYKVFDGAVEKLEVEGVGQGSGIIKISAPRNFEFENPEKTFLVYPENNSYLIAKLVDFKFKKQDTNKILYFQLFSNLNLLNRVESEINLE